jgi:hypothetical protein
MKSISPPTERTCERCGRKDVWDDERETWVAAKEEGEPRRGDPHCLHEWDINGTYSALDSE